MGVSADETRDAGDPQPLDHYRAGEDAPVVPGVYRVVGRDADSVTLLRVAEDGRRVHSGVLVSLRARARRT